MGFKKINPFQIITNGVMTGTAVITGPTQNIQNFDNIGFQFTWTGAAVGTIAIQFSLDNINFATVAPDYLTLTQPSNNATTFLCGYKSSPFAWVKVVYTNASSTGVLNVFQLSKDLN